MFEDELECGCRERDVTDYRLLKEVPMLERRVYRFHSGCAHVLWSETGARWHSLRPGLSGFLWLLRTEKGYFRRTKENEIRRGP